MRPQKQIAEEEGQLRNLTSSAAANDDEERHNDEFSSHSFEIDDLVVSSIEAGLRPIHAPSEDRGHFLL